MWLSYYLGLNPAQELRNYGNILRIIPLNIRFMKHKLYEIIKDLQDRICKFIRNILNLEII